MKPRFFATPDRFRAWLAENHDRRDELLVGFHKRDSGRKSITWPESVDAALCFGWIDGIRRTIDATSYTIRFTPRRPGSNWSLINIRRVGELTELGLMHSAGHAAFKRRSEKKSGIYSYETRTEATLSEVHLKRLQSNKRAWAYFQKMAPSYRKLATFAIATAKQEATRLRRLERLMKSWEKGERGW